MKVAGFYVMLLVLGTVLMFLGVSSSKKGSLFPDLLFNHHGKGSKMIAISCRKLKEDAYAPNTQKKSNVGNVNLDDYHPIDPSPSSKASIKPGPIEHGTPIIPYIPRPSPPPAQPIPGGSP